MSSLRNLFEADARKEVLERLNNITLNSKPSFGVMSVDQMLWHVNRILSYSMGEHAVAGRSNIFMKLFIKPMALGKQPFPKGGRFQTLIEWKANGNYDMEYEKNRFRNYIDRYEKSMAQRDWPPSPLLGKFTGANWARMQYKHIDHHFRQFGV